MLYIVATPIGNLEDVTFRALRILKEVDLILAEDTRVAQKLLARYDIAKPLESFHHHSGKQKLDKILGLLKENKNIALVSDAGTPGIHDPGNILVKEVATFLPGVSIVPVPGPSSVTTLLSIAGFNTDRFLFLGFPPHKKGRNKFFEEVKNSKYPVVFFESPHRIMKTLGALAVYEPEIIVGRELTKKFETVYRGRPSEILEKLKAEKIRGEFIVLVETD